MSDRECEEEHDASQPPGFSTPTKAISNDGAGHAELDAEGTEDGSEADVEKQFEESKSRRARSESTILSANTLKSSGGSPALIPYWSPNKSIMKFTRS
jgi:hypothetical protein